MDNLAHTLTGMLIAGSFFPKILENKKSRFIASGALIANLPDIDILLAIFGKEFYFFEHRGFTHSFLGLLFLIPISYWLIKKITKVKKDELNNIQVLLYSLVFLLVGHFLLDYLTSYGVMFLYPSEKRFSYPLMFIVDPLFWFIGIVFTLILSRKAKTQESIQKVSVFGFCTFMALWTVELLIKEYHIFYFNKRNKGLVTSYSSPLPFAPLAWNVFGKDKENNYFQDLIYYSFSKGETITQAQHPNAKDSMVYDQICKELQSSSLAVKKFERFQNWAEYSTCEWLNNKCLCMPIKYFFLSDKDSFFGGVFIDIDGNLEFIKPDFEKFLKLAN